MLENIQKGLCTPCKMDGEGFCPSCKKHWRDYIRLYKNEQGDLIRERFCPYPKKKNDQVIRETETEHNLHVPNQPDLVVKMYMARMKDAAASSLEPPSLLINQELQDEGTGYSAASAAPSQYLRVFGEAQGGQSHTGTLVAGQMIAGQQPQQPRDSNKV